MSLDFAFKFYFTCYDYRMMINGKLFHWHIDLKQQQQL